MKTSIKKISVCLAATALIAIIAVMLGLRACHCDTFEVSEYSAEVHINNVTVNAYKIADSNPYIVIEELPRVGLKAEFSNDNVSVSYTDTENMEAANLDKSKAKLVDTEYRVNDGVIERMYSVKDFHLISLYDLKKCGVIEEAPNINGIAMQTASALLPASGSDTSRRRSLVKPDVEGADTVYESYKATVFLDAGHGKSSSLMSDEEKTEYGWVRNANGEWGEWRHWRNGKYGADCVANDGGEQDGDCWYPIANGDRDAEPDINMQNCLAAKECLEQMGYKVVLSRESNYENPSITKRINDANLADADLYICVHSNAGGGRGSSYIALSEKGDYYAQHAYTEYAKHGNTLGKMINDHIVSETSLEKYSGGCIDNQPYLILFHKSPMICAYLEIGFFDNESDMSILNDEYDKIGLAIAEGIDEYCNEYLN